MSNPISPLRQRMIDDMTFRNMSPSTHKVYTYAVARFSTFHGRSPDKLGIEDVREYRLHLIARGLNPTIADAILDRLVHNAHRLTLKGESMRKTAAKRAELDVKQDA